MAEHNQRFETFTTWVNKASSWLTKHPDYDESFRAICYDAQGRICQCGADFMRARDEGTFPIFWYWPDQEMPEILRKTNPHLRYIPLIGRGKTLKVIPMYHGYAVRDSATLIHGVFPTTDLANQMMGVMEAAK